MIYKTLADYIDNAKIYLNTLDYSTTVVIDKPHNFFKLWDIDRKIAENTIWIAGAQQLRMLSKNASMTEYFLNVPAGKLVSYMTNGDQLDYETYIRPILTFQKDYYLKHGKLRNFFFFDLTHDVDESFKQEFKDVAKFCYYPVVTLINSISHAPINNVNLLVESNIQKHFLSLNARATWDRQALFYFMIQNNLLDKSFFSYLCQNVDRSGYGRDFDKMDSIIGNVWYSDGLDKSKLKQMVPYILDSVNWTYDRPNVNYYSQSFCSIILETFFVHSTPMFTEKTLKALAYGHPFLIFGSANCLTALKHVGFETFSDIFDESYDNISDSNIRLETMFMEVQRISKWTLEECQLAYQKIKPVISHNVNRYLQIKNDLEVYKTYAQPYVDEMTEWYTNKFKLFA